MKKINPLEEFWKYKQIIILDGALATELEREGEDLNDILWSAKVLITNPKIIQKIHLKYLKVGVDIITTSSYQATLEGFKKKGLKYCLFILKKKNFLVNKKVYNYY
jgi:homocysteine S-methyltransferase